MDIYGSMDYAERISIHAPREGGDGGQKPADVPYPDFNPRPPRGGRQVLTSAPSMPRLFQSTPPARGATCRVDEEKPVMSISIHAPREGGDVCSLIVPGDVTGISIHAPREGGDGKQKGKVVDVKISIHAPREGGDCAGVAGDGRLLEFQSTPPARGATAVRKEETHEETPFQSTPPARGATLMARFEFRGIEISIHAPREGGDRGDSIVQVKCPADFNPRPPRGGRHHVDGVHDVGIADFNPRPPRGGRLKSRFLPTGILYFNPRPPRGGRRVSSCVSSFRAAISIHAPREGGDLDGMGNLRVLMHFNPRPPRGGRLRVGGRHVSLCPFQSTPPARGATQGVRLVTRNLEDFNPRPPRGGRLRDRRACARRPFISIHAPREGGDRITLFANTGHLAISIHAPREGGDPVVSKSMTT